MNATNAFWTRKYQRHIAEMIGICYRYVSEREVAEDLAHDAFLRAMERADTLRVTESFGHWLTRITINTAVDYLREKGRMTEVRAEQYLSVLPDVDEDLSPETMLEAIRQADFTREEILEAVAQLPVHHRTVLNLYVFDGLNHRQIAETLGISSNTSKSRLMRARKELQIILFQKSQHKHTPLMTFFAPLFGIDAAFDRYCRSRLDGLGLPPQHPFAASDIQDAATTKLPLRVRFHAFRAPLAVGLGTAAVGAMLLPVMLRPPQPVPPVPPPPVPPPPVPTAAIATPPSTDTTAEVELPETSVETVAPTPARTATPSSNPEAEPSSDDLPDSAAAPPPVVVKKVLRHNNRTVVIKDSNR